MRVGRQTREPVSETPRAHGHVPAFDARLATPRVEVHAAPAPRLDHLLGCEVRRKTRVVLEKKSAGSFVAKLAVVDVERRREGNRRRRVWGVAAPRRLGESRFLRRARVLRGGVHGERFLELAHRRFLVAHLGARARAPPRRRGVRNRFAFSLRGRGGRFGRALQSARRLVHAERLHARGVRGDGRLALTLVGAQRVAPGGVGCLSVRERSGRRGSAATRDRRTTRHRFDRKTRHRRGR